MVDLEKKYPKVKKILIGNKCDLTDKIAVQDDDIKAFAEKYNMSYFIASAKKGTNVIEAFAKMA